MDRRRRDAEPAVRSVETAQAFFRRAGLLGLPDVLPPSCDQTGRDTVRLDPKTLVETLNRMLIGWANYFCLGAVSKAYSAVDMHARRRLRRWLCDKHNEPRPGYKRFFVVSLHSQSFTWVRLRQRENREFPIEVFEMGMRSRV